ncbi:uncharacterized protein KIAA2012 homolog [Watersipora subatra]|uniref:uncharacterized protein KIAA2012 homolog n=1 Tax=Watersipora subatra TaxID=2589382 RepID=UPI00355C80D1
MDDKKSVISTMSMLSKKSRFSSQGLDAPYTKGITSRQVDMMAGDFDPGAAITSWRYEVEQEEPYPTELPKEEQNEVVETRLDPTPVLEEEEESVHTISVPVVQELVTPDSVPLASEPFTPTPIGSPVKSSKTTTPAAEPEMPEEISESEFMEALTEQARGIAKAVLQQSPDAGHDLAVDVKNAAELLMSNLPEEHSPGTSSRAHSLSAAESADESASADTSPTSTDQVPEADAATVGQIVKEGLEDLVQTVDEYVAAEEGTGEKLSSQSPSIAAATPSVPGTHGHSPSVKSSRRSSAQAEMSTPLRSAAGSKANDYAPSIPNAEGMTPSRSRATKHSAAESILGGSTDSSASVSRVMSQRSSVVGHWKPGELGESTASAELAKPGEAAAPGSSGSKTGRGSGEGGSVLSKKSSSGVSTPKKSETKVQHETEFVVGKVADKTELQQLYAPIESPPAKTKTKPGKAKPIVAKPSPPKKELTKKIEKSVAKKPAKKNAGKKEKKGKPSSIAGKGHAASPVEKPVSPVKTPKPPTPVVEPKEPTPEPEEEEWKTPEPEVEADMEFVIVRDEFSDEEEELKPELGSVKPISFPSASPTASTGTVSTADEEDSLPPGLSNRDAQAAKRAAAKEKRRRAVENRRKEREEAAKREKEDAERKERIRLQMEEERLRREEEIRRKKEMEKEERERLEREEESRLRAEREAQERERKRQEEKVRILEEKRRRMIEEEERRKEEQALREAEEAERQRIEQAKLAAMAEEDRIEYLRRQEEEERLRRIAKEEARIRMEEENRRVMEELERREAERRQAEEILRQRLMFQRSLNMEAQGMDHTQDITRAFVFSYYELLKWLGYEVPAWAQFGPTPSADFIYNNHPLIVEPPGPDNIAAGVLPDPSSNQGHTEH